MRNNKCNTVISYGWLMYPRLNKARLEGHQLLLTLFPPSLVMSDEWLMHLRLNSYLLPPSPLPPPVMSDGWLHPSLSGYPPPHLITDESVVCPA